MEQLTTVFGIILLVGFFIAVAAYKPMRNRLILTKGYDADGGLGYILAGASIVLPLVLSINIVQSGVVLALCFIIPFVLNILLRIGKIGVGSAIMITALQTFGIIWVVLKWLLNAFSAMFGGAQKGGDSATAKMNADCAQKAELYRQYQARVAEAEANRDEALTMMGGDRATDAKIAEAERDYNRDVTKVGR